MELDSKTVLPRYETMKSEGRKVLGVSNTFDATKPPAWYDAAKFRRGQNLSLQYFESLATCSIHGFLLCIFAPNLLGPFYPTGKSSSLPKQFDRYLTTLLYFKEFFSSDPFDPGSESFKLFSKVRSFHTGIGTRLLQELQQSKFASKTHGILLVSQWDMGVVFWTQIAPIMLFPSKFGLHPHFTSELELDDMNYVWRVMGHVLGIEDRFNVCSGTLSEARGLYKCILENDIKPYLENIPKQTVPGQRLGHGILTSLSYAHPFWSYPAAMRRMFEILGVEGTTSPLYTWHDSISYAYSQFLFDWAMKFSLLRWIFCWFFSLAVLFAEKCQTSTRKRLQKKYSSIEFGPPGGDPLTFAYQDIIKCGGKLDFEFETKNMKISNKLERCSFLN